MFAQGLATFMAALVGMALVSLAIDWLFEPVHGLRIVLLVLAALLAAGLAYRSIVAPALVRISRRSLALLLERRFPQLADRLITAVDPAGLSNVALEAQSPDSVYHSLLGFVEEHVADDVTKLDLDQVFNPRPLLRSVLVAATLIMALVGLALIRPVIVQTWARRSLALSDELYPRRTRLAAPGFEKGFVKVARGADLKVVAEADTRLEVPSTVQIRYRTAGLKERAPMDREGNAEPGRDRFQKYSYTFNVLSPIAFDLVGGDDRIDNLQVLVVEPPTIDVKKTSLACQFPQYLAREPRDMPVTGVVSLPRGTAIVLNGASNKELAAIEIAASASDAAPRKLYPAGDDRRQFSLPLEPLDRELVLFVTLVDADGIRSREPWRLVLSPTPDEPPQLAVRLRGIGTAITNRARIPIAGPVKDDYALARVWYEHALGDAQPVERELARPAPGQSELVLDEAIEVRELSLETGKPFHLQVKARDNCGLAAGQQAAASERFTLQVVTPEELRGMLEARELNLRRRYEQLIGEVTETRDSLSGLSLEQPAPGAEPAPAEGETSDPLSLAGLTVERAIQNSRKNSDETLGLATSFDDIHDELVNNRVDTEELKIRLKQGIAEPLHRLAATAFPELDRRLVGAQAALAANSPAAETTLDASRQQLDAILVEMQQVLDKMVEMETFNEVVDMLRSIIDEQEEVNKQTRDERKAAARRLLED